MTVVGPAGAPGRPLSVDRPGSAGPGAAAGLPAVLRVPLSRPLFVPGALFAAVVHLLPGGPAHLPSRLRRSREEHS